MKNLLVAILFLSTTVFAQSIQHRDIYSGMESGSPVTLQTEAGSTIGSGALLVTSGNVSNQNTGSVTIRSGVAGGAAHTSGTVTVETPNASGNNASAPVVIRTGFSGTSNTSGALTLTTGNGNAANSSTGPITIQSGTGGGGPATTNTGPVSILSGNSVGAGKSSGGVTLASGAATSSGTSGTVSINSGDTVSGQSGAVNILSGTTQSGLSGDVQLRSGNATVSSNSGTVTIASGDVNTGQSGDSYLSTGVTSGAQQSGNAHIFTGGLSAGAAQTGNIEIRTGQAAFASSGPSGNVDIASGNSNGNSGDISIGSGGAGGTRGNIYVQPEVRFRDYSNPFATNYVGLGAPAVPASYSVTLPAAPPVAGQVLTATSATATTWQAAGGSATCDTESINSGASPHTIAFVTSACFFSYEDSSGGVIATELPTAVGNGGKCVTVIRDDAAVVNAITVTAPLAQTISGAASQSLTNAYQATLFCSNGTNWYIQ